MKKRISSRLKIAALTLMGMCMVSPDALAVASIHTSVDIPAKKIKIKGTVKDANNEPIIGASVLEVGKTNGVITDFDGFFELEVSSDAILKISYIGYKVVTVRATSVMDIIMTEDSQTLDEVVVVGFGTQKKVNLTGAVSVVSGKELNGRPVQSAAQALQGTVPGLIISSNSGQLDATPSINVRGMTTIGQGTSGSPLILIDGSEGDINTINPQDIESISVLKDAASSSIYGSRAPFGVILITTKKGSKGKPVINYNNSFRFSNLIRQKQMMNSVDFACWMNNTLGQSWFSEERMKQIVEYHNATPTGPGQRTTADGRVLYGIGDRTSPTWGGGYGSGIDDVDWYAAVYKETAFAQEHNASISGGSDKISYYTSFNYLYNGGFMRLKEDKYNRYSGTAKINLDLTDWAKVNYNMRFTRTDFERPASLTDDLYLGIARQGWPVLPLYDENGHYFSSPSVALALADRGTDFKQRDIISHQIGFVFEPIKNWITHIDLTYKIENITRHWDTQLTYNYDIDENPMIYDTSTEVYESEEKQNYMNLQAYTGYSFDVAKKHHFHIMGGFQAEQLKVLAFSAKRNGVLDPSKPELDLTSGIGYEGKPITPEVGGNRNQWQTAGFFGRFNYNYDEKYLIEFNIRHDGTSRFRRDNMWKTFPSVSIGYNMSQESYFSSLKDVVNLLKLRASYGSLGNQNTTNWYQTYQTIAYNSAAGTWLQNGGKTNTTAAPGLVSTSLGWETVESYNVGLDWGLFDNRLTGSLEAYIRDTKNMVGPAPELPAILGTGVPVTNNTDLRTKGWELEIGWKDILQNGFSYGVRFNISDSRTKITRYPNNPTNSVWNYIAGRYTNEIWGFETVGLAKTDEEMNAHLATTNQDAIGSNWAAGDIMYKDLDGDGKVTPSAATLDDHGDLKVIGNSTPRYLFGLDLNASWKGVDFRAFFQGVAKRDFFDNTTYMFGATGSGMWWATGITGVSDYFRNQDSWSVQNGYQEENLNAYLPRPQFNDKNICAQTRYLLNASYIRLKNLQLGYTLPVSVTRGLGISNLRFFVSAENLFTITGLPSQFDPETIGAYNSNGYPLSRTLSFGLNLTL